MKILVAGEMNPDLVLRNASSFPEPGKEVLVEDLLMTVGGSSANCAVGLARLGNAVTFANNAVLGGHVSVGDNAFLGGHAAVHQFVRVGEGVMIAGLSGIAGDVIPFSYARGQIADLAGLNVVGLRRRGATRADLQRLRRAFRMLFFGDGVFADRIKQVADEFAGDAQVAKIIAFIRTDRNRPLMLPRGQQGGDERDSDAV